MDSHAAFNGPQFIPCTSTRRDLQLSDGTANVELPEKLSPQCVLLDGRQIGKSLYCFIIILTFRECYVHY